MILLPNNIWKITGQKSGPTFCILGGTHGDEIVGVEVVDKLLDRFVLDRSEFEWETDQFSGTLYLGFGNPVAIEQGVRGTGGADLNRSFNFDDLLSEPSQSDRADLIRARELYPILKSTDILVDIHNTHADSEPFVCTGTFTKNHKELVSHIPVHKILTDPNFILSQDVGKQGLGTTDSVVNAHGGIGIAYETGSKTDRSHVDQVIQTLLGVLGITKPQTCLDQAIYSLDAIIKAPVEGTIEYIENFYQGWYQVKEGDKMAYINQTPICAPISGVLLFQKHKEKVFEGDSIGYIAKIDDII